MSQKQVIINPRTAKEAKRLLAAAVDRGDFEIADKYYQDLNELINFEDEMNLGMHVADYFNQNQTLSTKLETNCRSYEDELHQKISDTNQIFKKKLEQLQKKQESELAELAEKWQSYRDDNSAAAMADYQQSIVTAKLIAGQNKFKEAAAIKTQSMRLRVASSTKTNSRVDSHFEKQLKLMEERHKIEIKHLLQTRNNEIKTIQLMLREAPKTAGECFHVENANNVVNVTKRFKASRRVPLSLQLQTIHGRRLDPKDDNQFIDEAFDGDFSQKLNAMDITLTTTIPLTERKPAKKKLQTASPSQTSSRLY